MDAGIDTWQPRWKFERDKGQKVSKPSVVYFIECADASAIKVGFTSDVKHRLSTLQIACPYELRLLGTVPGDGAHEQRLHALFRKEHIRGEWFRDGGQLRAMIDCLLRHPEAKRTEIIEREPSLSESFLLKERNDEASEELRRLVEVLADEYGAWYAANVYHRACSR